MNHIIELKKSSKIKQHIKWNKQMLGKNQTVPPPNSWPQRRRAGAGASQAVRQTCTVRAGTGAAPSDSDCSISGGGTSPVAITGAAPRPRRHRHSQDAIGLSLSSLFSSNLTSPWQPGLTKCWSVMSVKERDGWAEELGWEGHARRIILRRRGPRS
jgi:hypothetical protein